MDNLEEIDIRPKTYNLTRLNHKETENLNRPIVRKETESEQKNLPTKIIPGQRISLVSSSKYLKKNKC